jgi:ATP-dependent protease ClpP protease subunit
MNEGHIYIDGVIGENSHLQVKKQIENLGNVDKLILHIQSPGGSVYAGYNTYHVIKSAGVPVEAIIEGECQSIATFIALAADKIIARNPSVFMIHNPYTMLEGDASAMESGASELRKIEDIMISAYQRKTNLQADRIREMMSKETSMTAFEAQQMGFVDEVIDPLKAVAIGLTKFKMEDKLSAFGAKLSEIVKDVFGGPQNLDVPMKDGKMGFIDAMPGEDFVGKVMTIDGKPAPAGEHELASGTIMVTDENGMITEIKESVSLDQQLMTENAALKAEIEALKAEKVKAEAVVSEVQAKNTRTMEMLAGLQNDFIELKKMTVGNPHPPVSAPVAQVKPVSEAPKVDELTEAFLSEFLPQFKSK